MIRFRPIMIILAALLLTVAAAHAQTDDEKASALIAIVADQPPFDTWLTQYPDWQANANDDDEDGIWFVEFYDESWEEWLGYANIDTTTLTFVDYSAPLPLSEDEYDIQLKRVTTYIMQDAEVLGWLNEVPDRWDTYFDFNRWERYWELNFYRGIRAVQVQVQIDENDDVYIEAIVDPNALDEEEALDAARNSAVQLAYGADGIWEALDGHDEWETYVEWQHDAVWSVSFIAAEEARFYALVDLDSETILETGT